MNAFFVRVVTLLALFWVAGAVADARSSGTPRIAAELIAETSTVIPGGEVMLAVVMRPRKGWHGYWENPGDAGVGMQIDWSLPSGARAGTPRYPVPERLRIAGLMNYVYNGDYALLVPLRLPAGITPGTALPIVAKLDYLACTDRICVPEAAEVAVKLVAGTGNSAGDPRFDGYRRALPQPLGSEGRFALADGRLRLVVPFPAALDVNEAYFFPRTAGIVAYGAPQHVTRADDSLIVETRADGAAQAGTIEGILSIGEGRGLEVTLRPGAVPATGDPLTSSDRAEGAPLLSVLSALGAAFVGGVLLNILPCVFPILSLKALSLARAGGEERTVRREALAYSAGVVLTCLALGSVLLALRAGGEAAGWAFQLQDPRVILFLLLLVSGITLNLAGVFELPAISGGHRLAGQGGSSGAFWTGALAAFIATPCTGPFMGAALGAALILPGAAALAIFAGLGLGLAFPFLALGFLPALRRRLPRPGPWMVRFRRWMAVPMALTAAGLAWVLSRQSGTEGLLLAAGAILVLSIALWMIGRVRAGSARWLPLAPAAAAALGALLLLPLAPSTASADVALLPGAERFSESRLAALRAQGRPVFLYFTADWCLTCKVNERGVLGRDEVARAFGAAKVTVLVGDWTRGDAEISRFLERHGRSGVPYYLYYPPKGEPTELPQLLSIETVTKLVA